jgi:hypothetical protein
MPLKGIITGISGRRVFFKADDAGKDDPPQEFSAAGDDRFKVVKQKGQPLVRKMGHAQKEVEVPDYAEANPADLKNGMAVRLMGPPLADLHTVVILPDDEQPGAKPKRAAHAAHAHHAKHK